MLTPLIAVAAFVAGSVAMLTLLRIGGRDVPRDMGRWGE